MRNPFICGSLPFRGHGTSGGSGERRKQLFVPAERYEGKADIHRWLYMRLRVEVRMSEFQARVGWRYSQEAEGVAVAVAQRLQRVHPPAHVTLRTAIAASGQQRRGDRTRQLSVGECRARRVPAENGASEVSAVRRGSPV